MKWSLERKIITAGFGMAICILAIVNAISYQNTTKLFNLQKQVEKSYNNLQKVRDVLTTLRDAERARRGYIITGNDKYLGTYHSAIGDIENKYQEALRATADNAIQQQRLYIIQPMIEKRISLIKESINLYKQNPANYQAQIDFTDEGIMLHDKIWRVITQMEHEEQQLLQSHQIESRSNYQFTIFSEVIGYCLSFWLLLTVYLVLNRQIYHRQRVEENQKNLEKEIELNEIKIRFFSMVSHEFRTPLSTILISAQLLENSTAEWSEAKKIKNLRRIQDSAKNMTQLLSDILTLSRAEAGKLEFNPQIVNLEELCYTIVEETKFSTCALQDVLFISQCSQKIALIDEKLLRSIIINLLTNAIKYSPADSEIHFIFTCEPGTAIFHIQDEGMGINLAEQQQLYQPFYRGANVGNMPGTGLGLAVVKKCVDLHGGSISLESQVGVGSKFTITIPWKN